MLKKDKKEVLIFMLFETYNLNTRFDKAKSFYGKAQVLENEQEEIKILQSYETLVCIIKGNHAFFSDTYSNTTLRHIKEFLRQNGFKVGTKKELIEMYSVDVDIFDNVIEKLGL